MNALNVLCAQLTRTLFAIAKFLLTKRMKTVLVDRAVSFSSFWKWAMLPQALTSNSAAAERPRDASCH